MSKEELMKLAEKYQAKADADFQNYQETGISRYGSSYRRNEDMAEALRMAAGAADEHRAYISMKGEMANFASRAQMAAIADTEEKRDELTEALVRDLASYGRMMNLIKDERCERK